MPELPEVETIVRTFGRRLAGRGIVGFRSLWAKNTIPSHPTVRRAIVGRTIRALTRRAKFIVFELDDDSRLLVHLRMSGRFEWEAAPPRDVAAAPRGGRRGELDPNAPYVRHGARPLHNGRRGRRPLQPPVATPPHVRAIWTLDDGSRLLFCDARKFGRIIYTTQPDGVTGELGPEPLSRSFTPARLEAILMGHSRLLKPLLLDQTVIAGLGNIYTDEALFRAGLQPLRKSDGLSREEIGRLHAAIRQVLRLGIRHNGAQIDWVYPGGRMQNHLLVYGRTGEPCLRCGTAIEALRVGQRGTHICPMCQPPQLSARTSRSAWSSSE